MNPRAYRLQLGIILLGILAWIPVSVAQNPVIADTDKAAGTVSRADIQKYIQAHVTALTGDDTDARTQAREALISGVIVKNPPGQQPGASYMDQYADVLNASLKPLATNEDWVIRMNAAIVAAKVAEKADNVRLLDVTQALLSDKTEGVQLWALRAGKSVLPAVLRTPGAAKNDKLIPAIVAVARQRKSGAIAGEAYTALSLDYNKPEKFKSIPAAVKTEMAAAVAPQILVIMRNRVADYTAGTINDPTADRIAANFLVSTSVWPMLDAKTQSASLQALMDLLNASGQAAAKSGAGGRNDDVLQIFRDTARALSAWAIKVPGSEALNRGLQEIYSPQNMKPWTQLSQVNQELLKLDKSLKAPGAPTTAPAAK